MAPFPVRGPIASPCSRVPEHSMRGFAPIPIPTPDTDSDWQGDAVRSLEIPPRGP